jgi:hypothetical protein
VLTRRRLKPQPPSLVHDGCMRVHAAFWNAGGATGIGQYQVLRAWLREPMLVRSVNNASGHRTTWPSRKSGMGAAWSAMRTAMRFHPDVGIKRIGEVRHYQARQAVRGSKRIAGVPHPPLGRRCNRDF